MLFDNRRLIVNKRAPLKDSNPVKNIHQAELLRSLSKLSKDSKYHKNSHTPVLSNLYKNKYERGVRAFIRGLFAKDYNLDHTYFNSYNEIVKFIKDFDKEYKINENVIALLKRRPMAKRKIPKSSDMTDFCAYVKAKFPDFDDKSFMG